MAALAVTAMACSGSRRPAATTTAAPGASAHDVVIEATSCWMGGLWSDALDEEGAARDAGINRRCDALLRNVDVASTAHARGIAERMPPSTPEQAYYPMRAVEPYVVDAIASSVRARAHGDPWRASDTDRLVTLLRAVANAARENVHARRAADRVKEDARESPSAETREDDKRAAGATLQEGDGLRALFVADVGPYAADARAIGLLMALDRMEIARGLPKHLKVYAVGVAFREVFGVAPPPVPDDPPTPVRSGTWLAYLTEVAAAAGHPVPADARDPQNREPLAWTGTLEGFADRLRVDAARSDAATPLATVERAIVARLDQQCRNERSIYEAHAPPYR